jgi:hypothetical protein
MLAQNTPLTDKVRNRLAAASGITTICGTLVIVGATLFSNHQLDSLIMACATGINLLAMLVFGSIHEGGRRKFFLVMAFVHGLLGLALLDAYYGFHVFNYLVENVHLGALTSSTYGTSVGLGMQQP